MIECSTCGWRHIVPCGRDECPYEAVKGATDPAIGKSVDERQEIGSATEIASLRAQLTAAEQARDRWHEIAREQKRAKEVAEQARAQAEQDRDSYCGAHETARQELTDAEASLASLRTALEVIYTAVRGDEKSQCWAIRTWLDERGVFNDDLGSLERLVEAACVFALAGTVPAGATPLEQGATESAQDSSSSSSISTLQARERTTPTETKAE